MQIAILEMPAENGFRVQLDGAQIEGFFERDVTKDPVQYRVFPGKQTTQPLRTQPRSREAAAMLVLFHHFEQERKRIERRRSHGHS